MSKEFLVIRAGRVVYGPGHYDLDGARATARAVLKAHPQALVTIVKILEVRTRGKLEEHEDETAN